MKNSDTAATEKRDAYTRLATAVTTIIVAIMLMLLLGLSSIFVRAAEVTPRSVVLGESVLIRTTPGANGLVLYCDGQSFRFLGELEQTVAYKPSQLGTCALQETQRDGSIIMSEFYVVDANAPLDVPTIIPNGQNSFTGTDDGTQGSQGSQGTQGTQGTATADGTRNNEGTNHANSTEPPQTTRCTESGCRRCSCGKRWRRTPVSEQRCFRARGERALSRRRGRSRTMRRS